MKKTNILIAVLAVLAAASEARAEEIKVDFDGEKGAIGFMEAIKAVDSCQNDKIACEQPKPVAVSVGNIGMPVRLELEGVGAQVWTVQGAVYVLIAIPYLSLIYRPGGGKPAARDYLL